MVILRILPMFVRGATIAISSAGVNSTSYGWEGLMGTSHGDLSPHRVLGYRPMVLYPHGT